MQAPWYVVSNIQDVPSPALVVYPERIRENIRRIRNVVGDVSRLRPHVKTHKMAEVVALQLAEGIRKFKCATIAEAEMLAAQGAPDVLLAYQPVGPNIGRMLRLCQKFPAVKFSALVDDENTARQIAATFAAAAKSLRLFVDLNTGMGRSGIEVGKSMPLFTLLTQLSGVSLGGMHVYDGHVRDIDPGERERHADAAMEPVFLLRQELGRQGVQVDCLIAGGTPQFPIHARRTDRECSPGTCILWDMGYATRYTDLDFLHAAVLVTRVISRPCDGRICLDLGYKAVSPDNATTRVVFPEIPDATTFVHNEEHLAIDSPQVSKYKVGDVLYGIPWHICPTCALHKEVVVVENGLASGTWRVVARDRMLSV